MTADKSFAFDYDASELTYSNPIYDTINPRSWSCSKREIFLGFIAFLGVVGLIVMGAILAVEMSKLKKEENSDGESSEVNQQKSHLPSGNTTNLAVKSTCNSPACLRTALYQKQCLDETVDPCKNFYNYACGSYTSAHPRAPFMTMEDLSPITEIHIENSKKMAAILHSEPTRDALHSYERKLKDFVFSCNNHFDRMNANGHPFIEKITKETEGWYLLDQWNDSNFDFGQSLTRVHVQFWTDAFFKVRVDQDKTNWNKKIVQLDIGGAGLNMHMYGNKLKGNAQKIYKQYMNNVTRYLMTDAGLDVETVNSKTLATTFIKDVLEIQGHMKDVLLYSFDAMRFRMTLGQINAAVGHTIDFTHLMKTMFNKWPEKFNDDTYIAVLKMNFFKNLGKVLNNYLHDDADGRRKLHNYMMWQLLHRYVYDLNWKYVHARRKFDHSLTGQKDTSDGTSYCVQMAEATMFHAMNAVFIRDFSLKNDTLEGKRIANLIKKQLLDNLNSFTWLSEGDRRVAKKKIVGSVQKIGYAGYMLDEDYMDDLYNSLSINRDDFFSNILDLNRFQQKEANDFLGEKDSGKLWSDHVFEPKITYDNAWHELIVTAATLQTPLFSHNGPGYYNYGGIGTLMMRSFVQAFDEIGNKYKLDGSNYGSWWSLTTTRKYAMIKSCMTLASHKVQLGPFKVSEGRRWTPSIRYKGIMASTLLAEATGLRLSYKAYMLDKPGEKIPPGIRDPTTAKMFFLAYAQTQCQNAPDYVKAYQLAEYYRLPSKFKINSVLAQVPEFAEAFQCPNTSPYVPKSRCLLFS